MIPLKNGIYRRLFFAGLFVSTLVLFPGFAVAVDQYVKAPKMEMKKSDIPVNQDVERAKKEAARELKKREKQAQKEAKKKKTAAAKKIKKNQGKVHKEMKRKKSGFEEMEK